MKTRGRMMNWMVALALLLFAAPLMAQNRYGGYYDDDQWLDDLVAPVALYPDDVLAIALPASSYPDDLRDAGRFLRETGDAPYTRPDSYWDESVRYLLNYPDVVYRMDGDPQWTSDLGSAFASDPRAVMEAIQRMRWRAYDEGFLRSDRRQRVIIDDGRIRIVSTNPEYVYIPDYDSSIFYSRPAGWSYGYYETAYPVYYYPYGSDYRFGRPFYGGQSAWGIDWWGWDICSGILLDWAFWHRSHHGDFYGWQRDWARHRQQPQLSSPYWRSVGTSIMTRPVSPQVRPLQRPIARPSNLPPLPVRPIAERPARAGRPLMPSPRPMPTPMVRPVRPDRPYQDRPYIDRSDSNRSDLNGSRSNRYDQNRVDQNRPELGVRPERLQSRPVVEPIERPERYDRGVRPMSQPRPDIGMGPQPVAQPQPVVRSIVQPVQPVMHPAPTQVEKPVKPERERKSRDQNDNDDQQNGGQRRGA